MSQRQLCLGLLLFVTATCAFPQSVDQPGVLDRRPTELLNEQLPSWLQFGAEVRFRFEEFDPRGYRNGEDSYLLYRSRFDLTIKPTKWLTFFGQTQDARAFYQDVAEPAPPYQNTWDLRQAYVRIGTGEDGPISLTVGRQEIGIGDERLVGSSPWTNTSRTFDALRFRLKRRFYRLDAFSASVVDQRLDAFDHHTQGNNLHGLAGGLDHVIPRASIEPYLLWRVAPISFSPAPELGPRSKLDQKTLGFRVKGQAQKGFDYDLEMAKQVGRLGQDRISAWAGHWRAGKTFSERFSPRLVAEYNFASGDANPTDGVRGTFDQLYPTAHGKYGYSDQVGWRNILDAHLAGEFKAYKRLELTLGVHDYWLANARDGLYNSSGSMVARSANGSAGRHVGWDLDIIGAYSMSKTMKFGVGVGRLFTGEFLNRASTGRDFSYPYVMLDWKL